VYTGPEIVKLNKSQNNSFWDAAVSCILRFICKYFWRLVVTVVAVTMFQVVANSHLSISRTSAKKMDVLF